MVVMADDLYVSVREVALAALIADRWSTLDHASLGHLAGFWLQAKIEPAAVIRIFKTIAAVVGGGYTDEILKFARATIAKFEAGESVTGGPKLAAQLGDDAVAKMRSWLKMADADAID